MSENKNNGLMPEQESNIIVPPRPLDSEDISKVSGGKKDTARIGGDDSTKKYNHFWDKFKKHPDAKPVKK